MSLKVRILDESTLTVQQLARTLAIHSFVHIDLEMMFIKWGMIVASWKIKSTFKRTRLWWWFLFLIIWLPKQQLWKHQSLGVLKTMLSNVKTNPQSWVISLHHLLMLSCTGCFCEILSHYTDVMFSFSLPLPHSLATHTYIFDFMFISFKNQTKLY